MGTCRTCRMWGPCCSFNETAMRVFAECRVRDLSSYSESKSTDSCEYWTPMEGEPRGTGISWIWYFDKGWDLEASIYHDLLVEGGQTPETDAEWLRVQLLLAKTPWQYTKSYAGYAVVRAWGFLRELFPRKQNES